MTNLTLPSRAVIRFYNKRGTAEPWIKEGKLAVNLSRKLFGSRLTMIVALPLPDG